jgi:hypothetical protein
VIPRCAISRLVRAAGNVRAIVDTLPVSRELPSACVERIVAGDAHGSFVQADRAPRARLPQRLVRRR